MEGTLLLVVEVVPLLLRHPFGPPSAKGRGRSPSALMHRGLLSSAHLPPLGITLGMAGLVMAMVLVSLVVMLVMLAVRVGMMMEMTMMPSMAQGMIATPTTRWPAM